MATSVPPGSGQPPPGPPPPGPPPGQPPGPPPGQPPPGPPSPGYPLTFSVDYPDRPLDRLSTGLRFLWIIPIAILLSCVSGGYVTVPGSGRTAVVLSSAGGLLFFAPLLMILFREKYPRWWFDWNLELLRFTDRVWSYWLLLRDEYPSTDEHQAVHVNVPYPDVRRDLNRWLPLVKWLLAIPHYIVLFFLDLGVIVAVVISWFAIVFTGTYPKDLFEFVVAVIRWHNRVVAYAFLLLTDEYPPFRLAP